MGKVHWAWAEMKNETLYSLFHAAAYFVELGIIPFMSMFCQLNNAMEGGTGLTAF